MQNHPELAEFTQRPDQMEGNALAAGGVEVEAAHHRNINQIVVLLRHKFLCLFWVAIGAAQHGHLDSVVTRATTSFRRIASLHLKPVAAFPSVA
jgi:hypothetical protein